MASDKQIFSNILENISSFPKKTKQFTLTYDKDLDIFWFGEKKGVKK